MLAHGADRDHGSGGEQIVAFDELVGRHAPKLLAVAYAMLGSRADAEDVVQETFLGAFRAWDRFQRRASVRTWLSAILVRQVARRRRSLARSPVRPAEIDPDSAIARADEQAGADARHDVAALLATLPPEHRDVLVLRELRGLRYDQIAEALGVPRGTVESRLHRARQALRERLGRGAAERPGGATPR